MEPLTAIITITTLAIAVITIMCSIAWYRIVDPSEAHLVVTPKKKFVVSSDDQVSTEKRKTYFAIPSSLPFFGRAIRIMDVTIKEIVVPQETYEKNQARFNVTSSTKYRISNVQKAAETFISDAELKDQLKEIVASSVRAVTVKYDVTDARAKKQTMSKEITTEMEDDLAKWGLELINFQLIDFQDTNDSSIISDISRRREVEIAASTREQNAEKEKQARIKEAEAEEKAREREIAKDKIIAEKEENKKQAIAVQAKIAEEKRFEVVKVQTIKQAEIDKEKAIVDAKRQKESEEIIAQQKKLEGQGDRARAEEIAKGEAAPILQKGLAEAEAKEALQKALNKFGDEAIRALVAEKVVEKDQAIGVATAQALEKADLKVFSGGESDKAGFDLGKLIESASIANPTSADALLNKVGRPNDLGFTALGLKAAKEEISEEQQSDKKSITRINKQKNNRKA